MANLTQVTKNLISTTTYSGITSDFSANVGELSTAVIDNVKYVDLKTDYPERTGQEYLKIDGDYIKISGNNFSESVNVLVGFSGETTVYDKSSYLNANVLFSNSNTIVASVQSFSTLNTTIDEVQHTYKLFVINSNGTYAFKKLPSAMNRSNYGYFAGGYSSSSTSVVSNLRRLSFSNFTTNTDNRGNLTSHSSWSISAQNKTYGYVYFGSNNNWESLGNSGFSSPASAWLNTYNSRIDFSNDSTAQERFSSPTNVGTGNYGGIGNISYSSDMSFYYGAGFDFLNGLTISSSSVWRTEYTTSTESTIKPNPMGSVAAVGSSSMGDYGYSLGGTTHKYSAGLRQPSSAPPINLTYFAYSAITRLNFTNDTNDHVHRTSGDYRNWSDGVNYNRASKIYFFGGIRYTRRNSSPSSTWIFNNAPIAEILDVTTDTRSLFISTSYTTLMKTGAIGTNESDYGFFVNSVISPSAANNPYVFTIENLMTTSSAILRLNFSTSAIGTVSYNSDSFWASSGLTGYI